MFGHVQAAVSSDESETGCRMSLVTGLVVHQVINQNTHLRRNDVRVSHSATCESIINKRNVIRCGVVAAAEAALSSSARHYRRYDDC